MKASAYKNSTPIASRIRHTTRHGFDVSAVFERRSAKLSGMSWAERNASRAPPLDVSLIVHGTKLSTPEI